MSLLKSLFLAAVSATSVIAYAGDMTYFAPGLGSCGKYHTESDAVVALSKEDYGYDANPNNAPVCGKWITITGPKGTARAQVWDTCPGGECHSGSIDVSPSVFNQIADQAAGRVKVTWQFDEGSGGGSPAPVPTSQPPAPVPTSEPPVPVPTTTSQPPPPPVPTTTSSSEVVVPPSTTSEVVVPPTTTSTLNDLPTTFSTLTRPSTTSEPAPTTTTALPGGQFKENDRVKIVVVTTWVTETVIASPTS